MKWSSISLFSSQRKKFSAKNIFVILSSVCNSTLKIAQMKMPFIAMIMVMIMIRIVRKKSIRKLINPNKLLNLSLYHHLYLCAWYCNRASLFCANNWKRCCRRWYFWCLRSLYRHGHRHIAKDYLKLVRSRNPKIKQFSTLPTRIVIAPDEIYDTYVGLNDDLELDTDTYKMLIRKASC